MATDNVKRYFSRTFEFETVAMPPIDHKPIMGLTALAVAYLILDYTSSLCFHGIERILLRSFPGLAEDLGYTNAVVESEPSRWGWHMLNPIHLLSKLHFYPTFFVICGLLARLHWPTTHLWILVARCATAGSALPLVLLSVLWGFEQFLLLSHKIKKTLRWVPHDEPHNFYVDFQQEQFRVSTATAATKAEYSIFSDSPEAKPLTYDDVKGRWHGSDSATKYVRERLRQMYQKVSPSPKPEHKPEPKPKSESPALTGYRLHRPGEPTEYYHALTAGDENQGKSIEELRLEHYQKMDGEKEARDTPQKSLLGSSISFLANSFLGNSMTSMASRDSFGRSTSNQGPLVIDGAEGDASPHDEPPDLLTGTPRKMCKMST